MNQVIKFERVYDPTLVGFDPLARTPHKGDGRYCFELFPKSRVEFEAEYPNIDLSSISFTRNLQGFNWSYSNNQEDILLMCDFYEKQKKTKRIVQLSNGQVMTTEDYKKFLEQWEADGNIEQAPAIRGKPRTTEVDVIHRYLFIENVMLEHRETIYPGLPIVFFDGNSIVLRQGNSGAFIQKTRPYVYHAKGLQQLKNFAGQTLGNELENLVQHKFMVAKEALPDEQSYLDAYTNVQLANTLVFKAFKDNDPKIPIANPIREVNRVPVPGEIMGTISLTDQMAQSILGSYDASLGINDNQLSGTAIVEGATQSNAAAMPYVVGFMQGLSQLLRMAVTMMPKYYVLPRSIPVVKEDGSRGYQKINGQDGIPFNYDGNALNVKVEAGASFAVQKSRTLAQIISMGQNMPIFEQFINTKGLKIILDNLEIKGSEQLKELADEFMQEVAEQKQQAAKQAEQAQQNNPMMIKAQNERMKLQLEDKQNQVENQLKAASLAVEKQQADTEMGRVLSEMHNSQSNIEIAKTKAHAEETRSAVDLAIKHADMKHSHSMSKAELEHKIKESKNVT
jgi:hypothetical protein